MNDQEPGGDPPAADAALAGLVRLHREIDERCARLEKRHASRLRCERGCHACCVDRLTVFAVEAERIRRSHAELLREAAPSPPGSCAFLDDEGACRIYADRPYVCRTQGLPLRWLELAEDGNGVELRDICPLNEDPFAPLETLDVDECWEIGLAEQELARLQSRFSDGSMARVALRELFERSGPD